jgi:hypothetical protein
MAVLKDSWEDSKVVPRLRCFRGRVSTERSQAGGCDFIVFNLMLFYVPSRS